MRIYPPRGPTMSVCPGAQTPPGSTEPTVGARRQPQRGRSGYRVFPSVTGPEHIEPRRTEPTRTDLKISGGIAAFPGTFQERVTWCTKASLRWSELRWTCSFFLSRALSVSHTHGHACAHVISAHAHGDHVCFLFSFSCVGDRRHENSTKILYASYFN